VRPREEVYHASADYVWPRVLNQRAHEVVAANGGSIVGEDYFRSIIPLSRDVDAHHGGGAGSSSIRRCRGRHVCSSLSCTRPAFAKRGGHYRHHLFRREHAARCPMRTPKGL